MREGYNLAMARLQNQAKTVQALVQEIEKYPVLDWGVIGSINHTAEILEEVVEIWEGVINLVPIELACPNCGCMVMDWLVIDEEDETTIHCLRCKTDYGT